MSLINFGDNSINGTEVKKSEQQNTEKTVYTKEQFTNSIMSATRELDKSAVEKYSNQAASIFDTYDTNPQDQKWNETEAKQGSSVLASFYQTINNAIKGRQNTSQADGVSNIAEVSEPSAASKLSNVPTGEEVEAAKQEFINKLLSANTEDEIQELIAGEFADIEAAGYQVANFDAQTGVLTIKAPDDQIKTINFYESFGFDSSQLAVNGSDTTGAVKDGNDTQTAANRLNAVLDKYSEQGYEPVGVPETNDSGELIGTLKNNNGEQIKINLNTGEEVKE
ncbi:MAG: hypothetical protein LUB59_01485 [Candidatus Gastranaerophilales bacterium]|nr:hypothetical protein [Candidatus Gastranaerophilales bacterium]